MGEVNTGVPAAERSVAKEAKKATKEVSYEVRRVFPLEKDDANKGMVRVHFSRIDGAKLNRSKFFRGEAVTILNRANGRKVVRFVAGTNQDIHRKYEDLGPDCAVFDYNTRDALLLRHFKTDVDLVIRRATLIERLRHVWNAEVEDPAVRTANRLGLIGFALGVISLPDAIKTVVEAVTWILSHFPN